ncbi:TspO/MBR family protein [Mangrovibrevibacter kandeliae]|uniref:TspO/MBR family protein n=1 Tax=Mangrovibrevibacter kandeliae TaxID=2968473 RepID=UPI002119187D|nr:TspO/MBR family protein [Aurantimonas sp. CSK15Z-1]MCQ8782868.1 tryptophan-rich sensory protein [Aurantimonas sp. CSK15Z-1]
MSRPSRSAAWPTLAGFLLLTVGGGLAIGYSIQPGSWYAGLAKPFFTPPNWLFAPAWTILYVLVAIAGWRVWRVAAGTATRLWALQLALNFLWTPVFFGLHRMGAGLAILLLLLVTILGFVRTAFSADRIAALLFLPYALWVAYASALNAALYILN